MDFGAALFFTVSPSFFMTIAKMFHSECRLIWAGRVFVDDITDLRESAFIAYIIRDQGFGKMEFIFQEAIGFDGVKGRVTKESIR